jgi:hypothetical protein
MSQLFAQLAAPPQLRAHAVPHEVIWQVGVVPQLSVQLLPGQSSTHPAAPSQFMLHEPPGHEKWTFAPSLTVTEQLLPSGHGSSQVPPLNVQAPATQGSVPHALNSVRATAAARIVVRIVFMESSGGEALDG